MTSPIGHSIGGYFGLEPPAQAKLPHAPAVYLQSARAALHALLEYLQPRRLWLPLYVCGVVPDVAKSLGVECAHYRLDEQLRPDPLPELEDGDFLLVVDFFGLHRDAVEWVQAQVDPAQLIVDNAQSLYAPPAVAAGTIYSPRKFLAVPDGGILVSSHAVSSPAEVDTHSSMRIEPMQLRSMGRVAEGYAAFQQAEQSLADSRPLQMSGLTQCLLAAQDHAQVRSQRRSNYASLLQALGSASGLRARVPTLPADAVPLCCPVMAPVAVAAVRAALAEEGIFLPRYWPDVPAPQAAESVESQLLEHCLFLPVDQRYGQADMDRLADRVKTQLLNA